MALLVSEGLSTTQFPAASTEGMLGEGSVQGVCPHHPQMKN